MLNTTMKSFKTFIFEREGYISSDKRIKKPRPNAPSHLKASPNNQANHGISHSPDRKQLDSADHEHIGTTSKGHRVYADYRNGDGQYLYHVLKKGSNRATSHGVSDHDRKITHKDLAIKHKSTHPNAHQMHGHDEDVRRIVAKDHNKGR